MNFYTLPVIINDRREKIINLNNYTTQNTAQQYIVEAHKSSHFLLLEIKKTAIFQSFISGKEDIELHQYQVKYHLEGNNLIVKFEKKAPIFDIPVIDIPDTEIKEEPTPLSYEDLELFKSVPKKKEVTKITNEEETISSNSEIIGVFQDIITLISNTYSNGAILLTGYVKGNYDAIKDPNLKNLNICIQIQVQNEVYQNSINFAFAHPEQFLGIALDFGSEASQMAIKRYESNEHFQQKRPEVENLYKNILAFNKAKNWISKTDNQTYYQEEKNTNFYKSIFFLKEQLSGHYQNIHKDLFVADLPDNLKMLVNTEDGYTTLTSNKYYQLPNLKITQKYDSLFSNINFNIDIDGYDVNIPLGKMKNKVYNSILKVMIESFLKKEFILAYDATRKIRFILLVPNIYDYYDIVRTQELLNEIFQSLAENEYKGQLLAWEIITISESDASFLGFINKNDIAIQPKKDYIIIDSGKGTTDLSIIKTGNHNVYNIKPMYRNGFAGAGNMITFGVFETILHYIRAHASNQNMAYKFIKEKIINVLNSNDLEPINKFYAQIERLKFKYAAQKDYVAQQWSNAKTGDIDFTNLTESGSSLQTLTELLSDIENISDFYGYIDDTCTIIATKIAQNIRLVKENAQQFDCGGVILSGRAFLFEPLQAEMKLQLQTLIQIPYQDIHMLNGLELKDICMKGVFNTSVRLNSEKIGFPIQIVTRTQEEIRTLEQPIITENTKPKKSVQSRLLKIFFNEITELETIEAYIPTLDNALKYNTLANSQIMIGSKRYKIIGNNIYNQQQSAIEDADILFTENGYLIRKKEGNIVQNVLELQEIFDTENVEINMVIPSLFPNYIDEEFIDTFQQAIDLQPQSTSKTAPIFFPLEQNKTVNNTPNDNKPKGPLYF